MDFRTWLASRSEAEFEEIVKQVEQEKVDRVSISITMSNYLNEKTQKPVDPMAEAVTKMKQFVSGFEGFEVEK